MITDIRLQHFRSYSDAYFDLDPSVNIVVGPNATGKTNLLEAVLLVARGTSYRAKDAELVQFDAPWARIDAHTATETRILKFQTEPTFSKSFEIDEQKFIRLSQQRMLPVVLFEPNHLLLLSGSPELRRSFLDDLIEQTQPGFGTIRRHYKRILAQRNALLKRDPPDLQQQLFVWNLRLSEYAGQIAKRRAELVERFNQTIPELYTHLAGNARHKAVTLAYASKFNVAAYESELIRKLEDRLELDRMRGFTGYGPHRDDLEVFMDGHPIQEVASRGETRTVILALKITELQLLEVLGKETPMLLLDDVFSELDTQRRQALTHFVSAYQTFITTTDADVITKHFPTSSIIPLAPLA